MNHRDRKIASIVCGLACAGLAAGLFLLVRGRMGYLLCYMEQRQTFLFSGAYLSDVCLRAGGGATYIANFITQFMCSPAAGAAAVAVCVLLSAVCLYVALRRFRWARMWSMPVCIVSASLPLMLLRHSYGFEVVVLTMAGGALAAAFPERARKPSLWKYVLWSAAFAAVWLMFVPGPYSSFRYDDGPRKENMRYYELEYMTCHGRWDSILTVIGDRPANYTELNYMNLALAEKGLLADRLLEHPQRGPLSLANTKHGGDRLSMATLAHVLYRTGDYAGAQSLAFSVSVDRKSCFSHPYMMRIVRNVDIIRGSDATVRRYDGMFSRTLRYRSWAGVSDVSARHRKSFDGIKDFFSLYRTPLEDWTAVLDADPDNTMAAQYAVSYAVLAKDIEGIRKFVERFFDTPAMNRALPRPVAEALIFYADYYAGLDAEFASSHGVGEDELRHMQELDFDFCRRYGVSDEVAGRYHRFKELFDRYGTGASPSAYREFRDTFWYYLLFVKL